jgi:NitT/TauT family transport system ATP-binding protein
MDDRAPAVGQSALNLIRLDSVSHYYGTEDDPQYTLRDVNFAVADGEFVCILGPSGCGKSTLLNLLVGFLTPSSGRIVMAMDDRDTTVQNIKIVMQHAHLFPWLTVGGNVEFGLHMRGVEKAQRKSRVTELLDLMGLSGASEKYPIQLSGGMQQRVAIARALAPNPRILLMDEPFGALDAQMRRRMQLEIVRIRAITSKTIIFVTHDIIESVMLADRIVVLAASPGRIKKIVPVDIPHPRERNRAVYDLVLDLEQLL